MGLDCTVYSRLEFIGESVGNKGRRRKYVEVEPEEAENGSPQSQGLLAGFYSYSQRWDWRVGGYRYYHVWRDQLACFAGYRPAVPPLDDARTGGAAMTSHVLSNVIAPALSPVMQIVVAEPVAGAYLAGAWDVREGPFHELLDYSDCQGKIGPSACRKLCRDFADHDLQAMSFGRDLNDNGSWYRCYSEWHRAFKLAGDTGLVDFH